MPARVDCLIEVGNKRFFACAAAWPGWCRSGRDEHAALEALYAYGQRYASVLRGSAVRFTSPGQAGALRVVERVPGNATTDFGAPDGVFTIDAEPLTGRTPATMKEVLEACWAAFDASAVAAEGVELRKGPRGGGRELDSIVDHVVEAELSYLRKLTGSGARIDESDPTTAREQGRAAVLAGLDRAAAGDVPERGPRGGTMWTPRRFLRRTAWHVLDHAWEIEDRASPEPYHQP